MKFQVEKYISNFVQNQFPQFYQEEGPNFILFLQAYYEWMEENSEYTSADGSTIFEGNPIGEARRLFDYRDIDNTLTKFLSHFQEKYLYGIPFNVIINQRFLLKHILDVYRSKGSIQSYKLLFKLIYNQDIEVYLPGTDLLKPSDGTWNVPKYLEVTNTGNLASLINKTIVGVTSNTTAIVENVLSESINKNIVNSVYISNIEPKGATFFKNEKIVAFGQTTNSMAISNAPVILGSLNYVKILNGGQDFNIGDTLKIVHRDITNNQIISFGDGGYLKVTGLSSSSNGQLNIDILNGGFGFNANAHTFIYNGIGDTTGSGASFSIGSISYTKTVPYNTDVIADYLNTPINGTYGFPLNPTANLNSTIQSSLSYTSNTFGTISSISNIKTGSGYTNQAFSFARSTLLSKTQGGTLSYSTASNNIVGTSTSFTTLFANGDVIYLQANSTVSEYQIIKQVVNNSLITLYGPPSNNTATGTFKLAPSVFPSNFAVYEPIMYRSDNTINGLNAIIEASSVVGGNVISTAIALDSGKSYVDNENIVAYLYGSVNDVIITAGGFNYAVNDKIIFASTDTTNPASATVSSVDGNGAILTTSLISTGSGYINIPNVRIQTKTGHGALLSCTINEFKTTAQVQGQVIKGGVGTHRGRWTTTKGFLNSDKYIQDSYFYQDYSYQIKVATALETYKNILYNTFHPSGSELFGEFLSMSVVPFNINQLLYNSTEPELTIIEDELADILVAEDGSTILIQENVI